MEAMKRTVDELRIINDALVQDIKRLKKENADLVPVEITAVSVGTQTDMYPTDPVDNKHAAFVNGLGRINQLYSTGFVTKYACVYATTEFQCEYEHRRNRETFTVEKINTLCDTMLSIADTITVIQEAGVDVNTYNDEVSSFVEQLTVDSPKHSARWFNRQVDDFIDNYVN